MGTETGKLIGVVIIDSQAERATVMNVGKHTIPVDKLGRVVAVVRGSLCPDVVGCTWCEYLLECCLKNRKA